MRFMYQTRDCVVPFRLLKRAFGPSAGIFRERVQDAIPNPLSPSVPPPPIYTPPDIFKHAL